MQKFTLTRNNEEPPFNTYRALIDVYVHRSFKVCSTEDSIKKGKIKTIVKDEKYANDTIQKFIDKEIAKYNRLQQA